MTFREFADNYTNIPYSSLNSVQRAFVDTIDYAHKHGIKIIEYRCMRNMRYYYSNIYQIYKRMKNEQKYESD